jgi:hypothetical protein
LKTRISPVVKKPTELYNVVTKVILEGAPTVDGLTETCTL